MPLFKPRYPLAACEVSKGCVSFARLSRRGEHLSLEDFTVEPLAAGALSISMVEEHVRDPEALSAAVGRAARRIGGKGGKVSLVLPDGTTKLSILEMETPPRSRREMAELVSWQLKKVTPYPIEEGRIAYHRFGRPVAADGEGGLHRVMVAIIRRAILEQYERCLAAAGLQPGLVDISSNNVYNLFQEKIEREMRGRGDCMLVNCEDEGFSLFILAGSVPFIYRGKSSSGQEEEKADMGYDHGLVMREIRASLLYYTEKLEKPGLERIYLRGTGLQVLDLRDRLERELGLPAEILDPGKAVQPRPGLALDPGILQRLAPALGAAMGR
jgi:Tfp pilus assembly PilM family ATPase